jgi:hypothetical protein
MYLPGVSIGVTSTTAKVASNLLGPLADNFKTFLDSVNTAAGTSGQVILASKGRRQANQVNGDTIYIGGLSAHVTGCRIGDVYDTQRRRRNQIPETYIARVLA